MGALPPSPQAATPPEYFGNNEGQDTATPARSINPAHIQVIALAPGFENLDRRHQIAELAVPV